MRNPNQSAAVGQAAAPHYRWTTILGDNMPWGLFEVVLVIVALFSQIAMINHAMANDKDQSLPSLIFFYNVFRIPEYIEITKKEKGRIGAWFWTFVGSIIVLIFVVVMEVITGP
jgi:hypothetical protein